MPRRTHSSAAFWLFLVFLAVGFGWASNEWWRVPTLDLFDWESDQPETLAQSEAEPAGTGTDLQATSEREASTAPVEATAAQPTETVVTAAEPADPAASRSDPEPSIEHAPVATLEGQTDPPQVSATAEPAGTGSPADEERVARQQVPKRDVVAGPTEESAADLARQEGAMPQGDGAQDTEPQSAALQEPAPTPDAHATTAPSFDIVRVERDGRAVIAGRAAPGTEVEVRSGEQVIDRVRASRGGEWVSVPIRPLEPGDQQLSAVAVREDAPAVKSERVLVVAVPEPDQSAPSQAEAKSGPEEPVAVLLPRDSSGTGRVLQAPGRLSAKGTLALTTVSYDESGKILLSGEAPAGVPVRIYVDNRPAAVVVGDAKGTWASSLDENLGPGTYTLRLDQLDAEGQPVARIETPLSRVSEPPIEGELQVDYVVVQPGNSLWRIARRLSGRGLDYVYIYDANQAEIRDPDLIYPGQVFEIPGEIGSSG